MGIVFKNTVKHFYVDSSFSILMVGSWNIYKFKTFGMLEGIYTSPPTICILKNISAVET